MVNFKTSQKMWSEIKPNITHLRPFGCTAYAHVSQGNLEPRAIKCVMIGYPEGVKGYKLLVIQPGAYKCFVSRDVVFNEVEFHYKKINTPSSDLTGDSDGNFFDPMDNDDLSDEDHDNGVFHNVNDDHSLSGNDLNDSSECNVYPSHDIDQQCSSSPSLNDYDNLHDVTVQSDMHMSDSLDVSSNENSNDFVEPNLADYQLVRVREPRTIIPNRRYMSNLAEFVLLASEVVKNYVPDTFEQAVRSSKSNDWFKAMQEEMQYMFANQIWVPKPKGAKVIDCR
ncbi:unnamed protein product [Cuscuta europaea]|uniref:Retroviral polymerase SH3-like domain-containing protein n=1 Tax=Cuscuta europaea TaxID=41803 RepID=A0A9P0YTD4_CUSEU|nr:unnamed protein product [Cuscuta europaea]